MLCPKKHHSMPYLQHRLLRLLFFLSLTCVTFFSGRPLEAQEKFVPAPSKLITTFPFTVFTGGVILMKARLGDFPDSLNFILDTGSGGISLDSATVTRLK